MPARKHHSNMNMNSTKEVNSRNKFTTKYPLFELLSLRKMETIS